MKLGKRLLTAGLIATSVLGAASCGGSSNQLDIFLYQENVAFNANMEVFKRANAYAGVELKGVIQQYDSIMISSLILKRFLHIFSYDNSDQFEDMSDPKETIIRDYKEQLDFLKSYLNVINK